MTQHEDIIKHLMDIRDRIAKIEQHLKQQNDKIIKNEERGQENRQHLSKVDIKLAKYGTGIIVGIIILEILIKAGVLF